MMADTTFLLDVMAEDDAARALAEELEAGSDVLWVPSPVVFEVWEGIERADRPREEQVRAERVLAGYTTMALEPDHARRAGRISADLVRRGEMLEPVDVLIAGMAVEEGEPLLTRNVRHFERVRDLQVETY